MARKLPQLDPMQTVQMQIGRMSVDDVQKVRDYTTVLLKQIAPKVVKKSPTKPRQPRVPQPPVNGTATTPDASVILPTLGHLMGGTRAD